MEFNYLVERTRMLNSLGRTHGKCAGVLCQNCPLYLQNKLSCTCYDFEANHPFEATEVVRKWAEEHPRKTRKDVFLKKFPKARLNENGNPFACCLLLGMGTDEDCRKNNCTDCWNAEAEE